MSLKTAFASVLKATRASRGLSQKALAEVSSRTYISKLERAQSSPTLEMITALSVPLNLSPLAVIAMTLSAETGVSIKSLVGRLDDEVAELAQLGVLNELQIAASEYVPSALTPSRPKIKLLAPSSQQTEFCFPE